MNWFTSDHHFGHNNILKHCKRPFSDVGTMNFELIERWNSLVKPEDIVWHLGDFTLDGVGTARHFFMQLNGQINILANHNHHDKRWLPKQFGSSSYLSKSNRQVHILPPVITLEMKPVLVLCHFPLLEWDRKHYGAIHLHGHSHGTVNSGIDVGVDCWDFYPVDLNTLIRSNNGL